MPKKDSKKKEEKVDSTVKKESQKEDKKAEEVEEETIKKEEEPQETKDEVLVPPKAKEEPKKAPEQKAETKAETTEEPKEEKPADTADVKSSGLPKVASFSMLDAKDQKPAEAKDTKKAKYAVKEIKEEEIKKEVKKEKPESEDENVSSEEVKEWLKDIKPDTTKEVEKKAGVNFKPLIGFVALLIVVGAIAGGVFYYKTAFDKTDKDQGQASEQVASETSPTATPVPEEVDLSTYSVSILNGSGIVGEAGKVSDVLEEAGFSQINTGNADAYDYESTSVSVKEGLPDAVFEKLRELLAEDYAVIKSEEALETDSTYDLIIIVGVPKE